MTKHTLRAMIARSYMALHHKAVPVPPLVPANDNFPALFPLSLGAGNVGAALNGVAPIGENTAALVDEADAIKGVR